jgi:hypothetical protein
MPTVVAATSTMMALIRMMFLFRIEYLHAIS